MACPCQSCCHWREKTHKKNKKRSTGLITDTDTAAKETKDSYTQKKEVYFPLIGQNLSQNTHSRSFYLPLTKPCEKNETFHSALARLWLTVGLEYVAVLQDCTACQTITVKTCVRNICFLLLSDKHMTSSIISPLPLQLSPLSLWNRADNFQHLHRESAA